MAMTEREKQLAVLEGRTPDKIPFMPRLEIWYTAQYLAGTLPPEYQGKRLKDIQDDVGVGASARTGRVYTKRLRGVEVVERRMGLRTEHDYVTPIGTVTTAHQRTVDLDNAGITALEIEQAIKTEADYDVCKYIIENTEYYPAYDEFEAYDSDIGDRGLPMVATEDVPFHHYLNVLVGYGKGYLDIMDYPDKFESLLEVMENNLREKMWPVVANSPGTLFLHGAHLASTITPPNFFDKYLTPYMREFADYMHDHGKIVGHHADNDTRSILSQLKETDYDMHECFATAPLVPTTFREAREGLGPDVTIFGAIPSVVLEEDVSDSEFEEFMEDVFDSIAPGDRTILGIADNMMPSSKISRVKRVVEMIDERGTN
jgi:uroporphyrinogen-III decarboxylase